MIRLSAQGGTLSTRSPRASGQEKDGRRQMHDGSMGASCDQF